MSEVPVKTDEDPMLPTEREKSLWDYRKVSDAELKIVIAEVAEGHSLKDVVKKNPALKANYKEIVRALHQDPEARKVFLMARGVQMSGFIDNIIEQAEEEIPDFCYTYNKDGERTLDKLKSNMWLQNRRLKIDAYTKLIRSASAAVTRTSDSEEESGNGITINITQFANEKLKDAKTITVEACKEDELDA